MSRLKRQSRWTSIYMGTGDLENPWYIRLAPDFMNLSAAGFSHGLSISGNTFPTKEAAWKAADLYDKFFDKMYDAIADDIVNYNSQYSSYLEAGGEDEPMDFEEWRAQQ